MNKEVWKRILESFDDQDLVALAHVTDFKVPGFRKITQSNITSARKKFITEALKLQNLRLMISFFNKKAEFEEKEEEEKHYRKMKVEELEACIHNGVKPYEILAALYSSEEEGLIALAGQLEEALREEQFTSEKAEKEPEEPEAAETDHDLEGLRTIIAQLEKKIKRADQRNQELSAKNEKLTGELKKAKDQSKEEKKELNRKIASLNQDIASLNKQLQQLEESETKYKKAAAEKDQLLADKMAQISHLNAKLLTSEKVKKSTEPEKEEAIQDAEPSPRKRIALLGNPRNKGIMKNKNYDLEIFEASDFEEVFERVEWNAFNQILLLKYKVPSTKQAFIQTHLKQPLMEVNTFIELQSMIERGI